MSNKFVSLVREIEYVAAGRRQLAAIGPHFTICQKGHITWVLLVHGSRESLVRLSPALLFLFDYLAHRRRIALSALQIANGLSSKDGDEGQRLNVAGIKGALVVAPKSIKVYVQRLRRALQVAFREAGLNIDASTILSSERVDSIVLYRLRATTEWICVP